MKLNPAGDEKTILAHWTYTREEWKAFLRWKKLQRSVLHYVLHRLTPAMALQVPEVIITHYKVITDQSHQIFNSLHRELRRVNIKDAGPINIIEIIYEQKNEIARTYDQIRLPIPRGKLREAIDLQERLSVE